MKIGGVQLTMSDDDRDIDVESDVSISLYLVNIAWINIKQNRMCTTCIILQEGNDSDSRQQSARHTPNSQFFSQVSKLSTGMHFNQFYFYL